MHRISISGCKVIEGNDINPLYMQHFDHVGANISGPAHYEDFHLCPLNLFKLVWLVLLVSNNVQEIAKSSDRTE
jgi:hypothetical protein